MGGTKEIITSQTCKGCRKISLPSKISTGLCTPSPQFLFCAEVVKPQCINREGFALRGEDSCSSNQFEAFLLHLVLPMFAHGDMFPQIGLVPVLNVSLQKLVVVVQQ